MRLRGDDARALAEPLDVDTVGDLEDVGHVVADQNDGKAAATELTNDCENLIAFADSQRCGRFVEHDHLAAERDRPGDRHRLPLTA
jgi:hypothetical protein